MTRRHHTRRGVLQTGFALGLGSALAGCLASAPDRPEDTADATADGDTTDSTPTDGVGTELVASGFTAPLGVEFAPGDTENAYVVDQTGVVRVATPDGVRDEPLLDVRDRMVSLSGYEERGLLGAAFHPDYPDDPRLFARYSAPLGDGAPSGYSHTFVLSAFTVDGGRADPASERRLLELPQPQSNHNAGSVVFGPDGYLYVGTGDGGGANDTGRGHVDDWYDANAGGNGQDTERNLLGSVLRIDVDGSSDGRPYAIPDDNPLVGEPGLDEQYAWGFRNPWRMSFADGDLYVADVGQNRFEEVSVVERGGNYGWNVREATHCFSASSPNSPPENCPRETPDGDPLRDPVIEYSHSGGAVSGISVIGGYRYTGDAVPALSGEYVFGDWRSNGDVFVATPTDDGLWPTEAVSLRHDGDVPPREYLLAFGRDYDDELYVATTGSATPTGSSGRVHRLVSA
ncbi:PQQ-dependent sugar dehydrogenase [Halobacterium litoreum]|uniref:PQQ-dependent sugar dehydrogenase n=1 Tax=Halobacterium litoreum TaxID=2039234 RepID=A0ABD5NAG6_9EURY|nr:PQQ-dependent sugar dehydrogenase [Halobacterium litoreum]UHH14772.1 PQQ-dependent sugar dehydrogenase [Halobacterium litoreum]